jgi:DNA primase catalytic core
MTTGEQIKRRVDLKSVITHFGGAELHGDGDTLTGWHKAHESQSKRSLHVDNAKGVWYCQNCKQGGDMFSWVGHLRRNGSYRDTDKTMFVEAMREIADFAGVEIPAHDKEKTAERRSIEEVWQIASDFYHSELTDEHRSYFYKRGYTDKTIAAAKLGYAPQGPRTLLAHLVKVHKIDGDELVKSGLFLKRDNGDLEDHFQGRLMFPYLVHGRVAYFIGRITDQSPTWEHDRSMKYKKLLVNNDKHSYVSEQVSNRYFYGEDSVKPGGDLLITEGVADCLSALQEGFSCVSPVTVRFAKKDHGKILEFAERAGTVYICNDNEASNAGGDGTLATAEMLWHNGKVAKIVTLPRAAGVDKVDLNDFLSNPEQGPEALKKLMAAAKTLLDLRVEEYTQAQTDDAKIEAQRAVVDLVAYIKDKFQLELWKRKLPKEIGLSTAAFCDMLKDAQKQHAETEGQERAVASEVIAKDLGDEGYTFALNELADTIEVNGHMINTGVAAEIRTRMRDLGYRYMEEIEDVYTTIAHKARYHPVKRYLEGLKWDGKNHLRTLGQYIKDDHPAIIYPEYPNSPVPVFDVFMGRWMVGAVAKLYEAGKVKAQNPVLVLDGPQNLGKSSFARWIGSPLPELMIEGPIRPDDKDHQRFLASMWIWEISELGATTRRADREALKDFITKHEVTFRKPYDRHPVSKPALASFIGTINNENGFLTDPTGNRRFLTVRLKSIDWRYLDVIDINQLWAQAFALYKDGASWTLTPVEIAARDARNAEYMVEDPYEGWILKYYDADESQTDWLTTTTEITDCLQSNGVKGETRQVQMAVAASLKRMGLRQHANARPRAWVGIQRRVRLP